MPLENLSKRLNELKKRSYSRDALVFKAAQALSRGQIEGITVGGTIDKIVAPRFNYEILWRYGLYNPVLRKVIDAIIKECMRGGPRGEWYIIEEKFVVKCVKCGIEYQKQVDKCEKCDGEVREPLREERKILEQFCREPSPQKNLKNLVQSLLRYMLGLDDYWLNLKLRPLPMGDETFYHKQVEVKDTRFMRVCMDEHGNMGNEEYFCPKCWSLENNDIYTKTQIEKGKQCKKCGGPLEETWYTEVKSGGTEITDRFAAEDIIHDNCDPQYPYPYGNPKPVGCLFELRCITAQNVWNLVTQTEGKTGQFIIFEGMNQEEVNELMKQAHEQAMSYEADPAEGLMARRVRTFGVGNPRGNVSAIDTMPDPSKMQSIEWRRQWAEEVSGLYGVTPIFTGVVDAPHYRQTMQIDVQNNTTLKYQHEVEEPFNNIILPWLGVHDWTWHFRPLEEKDELADSQLLQVQMDVLDRARHMGLYAELTEDGEIKVYGKPEKPEPMEMFGQQQIKPGEGVKPPAIPSTAAKSKKPKKWLVIEGE